MNRAGKPSASNLQGGCVVSKGMIFRGTPGSPTASACLGSICLLDEGHLLASWRVGSTKESADGRILISRSNDQGSTWSDPIEPFYAPTSGSQARFTWEGVPGELHFAPLTHLGKGHVMTAMMWFDRSDPELPMFNPDTEGLLPVRTLLAESSDGGQTWSAPWMFDATPYDGFDAVTAPMFEVPPGEGRPAQLVCQFETNKPYNDTQPWMHRAMLKFSGDGGRTWAQPTTVAHDPSLKIRYWDQRHAQSSDGLLVAGLWAYDAVNHNEMNFHMTWSQDGGQTWSPPCDSGLDLQQPYPVFLPDGRLVVIVIDRYRTRSIRALVSHDNGHTFDEPQLVVHEQPRDVRDKGEHNHEIADQQLWTFGRVEAVADTQGDVWMIYYAGDEKATHVHWAQLRF